MWGIFRENIQICPWEQQCANKCGTHDVWIVTKPRNTFETDSSNGNNVRLDYIHFSEKSSYKIHTIFLPYKYLLTYILSDPGGVYCLFVMLNNQYIILHYYNIIDDTKKSNLYN